MGFFEIFASVLAFFYALVPNLGIAIILLTVTVMLLMFPLTAKQAKSMVELQRLQPEMKRLQQKHRGDRQKLNEEMMKLYQEHKVNPLGGCLPLVVQMPVFIALFQVLQSAYEYVPQGSSLYKAFCDNANRDECKASDTLPNHLTFLGMDLSESAQDVSGSILEALPYFALVGLVVLTGYFQSRQSQRNNPQATGPAVMITKVLPIMFGVFSIGFPSGLVLYFLTSNLWRLGQQELIMRKIAPRPAAAGSAPARAVSDGTGGKGGNGAKGGGFLSRLMAAPEPEPEPESESESSVEPDPEPDPEPGPEPEPEKPSAERPTTASPSRSPASRASGRSRARRKKRKRR